MMTRMTVIANAVLAASTILGAMSAQARDLTVTSWGGTYQDAQREIYFKPFAEKTGRPAAPTGMS